ncbi:hypothetical protein SERLA73DRAFT_70769 [Serpula lacrymans var. lacrymans S7.3]|uniref:Uncharacterized protein n=2 Tax=Serpula lacrymans var. lacrymans TaxID=341189 RepID=F8PQN9_SERL3|nr:uncharacterized protein SERLADRAFT_435019 [Serpula lacrymans var. lacrymans S7.9]EGO01599.1 hypothetical protein SERLA73DRAFT_70769 [Serpula lacrymans var. lacrymans S7.3]EGO27256.1 hypothetical protein SERLADRAFT_435019 [Serpula lacrymans var. lacrymans S7.9]
MTGDDVLDAHESGIALVASRNPFRETGPPACMAKLIMLRHKMQTSTRRRRSLTPSRQAARNFVLPPPRTMNRPPWIRFGKQFGIQHH